MCACVSFTRRHPAHPVTVPILHPIMEISYKLCGDKTIELPNSPAKCHHADQSLENYNENYVISEWHSHVVFFHFVFTSTAVVGHPSTRDGSSGCNGTLKTRFSVTGTGQFQILLLGFTRNRTTSSHSLSVMCCVPYPLPHAICTASVSVCRAHMRRARRLTYDARGQLFLLI